MMSDKLRSLPPYTPPSTSEDSRKKYYDDEYGDLEHMSDLNFRPRKLKVDPATDLLTQIREGKYRPDESSTASHESEVKEVSAPGEIESLVRGAAQGATFGFADEMTAALESLFSKKSYEQAVAESRARYKQAEENHGFLSGLGYVGGSLLPIGMVNKALGAGAKALAGVESFAKAAPAVSEAVSGAAKVAPEVAEAGQQLSLFPELAEAATKAATKAAPEVAEVAAQQPARSGASKLAELVGRGIEGGEALEGQPLSGILPRTLGMAVEGGAYGALTGAGTSENIADIPKNMWEEGKTGATWGAGLGTLGSLAGAGIKEIAKSPIGKDIQHAFEVQKQVPGGVDYLDADMFKAHKEQKKRIAMDIPKTIDEAWNYLKGLRETILSSIKSPVSLSKAELKALDDEIPRALREAGTSDDIQKVVQSIEELRNNRNELSKQIESHPLGEFLLKNELLRKILTKYHASNLAVEASIKPRRIIEKSASEVISDLEQAAAKIGKEAYVTQGQPVAITSPQLVEQAKAGMAKLLAQHPVSTNPEMLQIFTNIVKQTSNWEQEIQKLPNFTQLAGKYGDVASMFKQYMQLSKAQSEIGKIASNIAKPNPAEAEIKAIYKRINAIKKSMTETMNLPSEAAMARRRAVEQDLMSHLKNLKLPTSEAGLNTSSMSEEQKVAFLQKQVDLLKTDKNILSLINQLAGADSGIIKNQKLKTSMDAAQQALDRSSFKTAADVKTGRILREGIDNLAKKYRGLQNLSPEELRMVKNDIKDIEVAITGSKGKLIGEMAETNPTTVSAFNKLKNSFDNAITSTPEGARYAEIKKMEAELGTLSHNMFGDRPYKWSWENSFQKWPKKIINAFSETPKEGETGIAESAEKLAEQINYAPFKDAIKNMKFQNTLTEGFKAAQGRHGLFIPVSKEWTLGVASKVANKTQAVGEILSDAKKTLKENVSNMDLVIPNPKLLEQLPPETAQNLKQIQQNLYNKMEKYPSVQRMLDRLNDQNMPDMKRRVYTSILLNNPIVRKQLTEHSGE